MSKPASSFLYSRFTVDNCTDKCTTCIFALAQVERDRRERAARRREAAAAEHAQAAAPPARDKTTKTCTCCHARKPVPAFAKHARAKDGLQKSCRDCAKAKRQKAAAAVRRHVSRAKRGGKRK
jgi:hypothetical protein